MAERTSENRGHDFMNVYRSPRLTVYGGIAQLTTAGTGAASEGATGKAESPLKSKT